MKLGIGVKYLLYSYYISLGDDYIQRFGMRL